MAAESSPIYVISTQISRVNIPQRGKAGLKKPRWPTNILESLKSSRVDLAQVRNVTFLSLENTIELYI